MHTTAAKPCFQVVPATTTTQSIARDSRDPLLCFGSFLPAAPPSTKLMIMQPTLYEAYDHAT